MKSSLPNPHVLAVLTLILTLNGCGPALDRLSSRARRPMTVSIAAADDTVIHHGANPIRLYVHQKREKQIPPAILLRFAGLPPLTRLFLGYRYQAGPGKEGDKSVTAHFRPADGTPFNAWENSIVVNRRGEGDVVFIASTYAGDRFRIGAALSEHRVPVARNESRASIRFRNAVITSGWVEVWKHIRLEPEKVLCDVRFPRTALQRVQRHLEKLHIHCLISESNLRLDPRNRDIYYYFFNNPRSPLRGRAPDARYGPAGYGPLQVMLSRITILFSDADPGTINLLILGAVSPGYDLIGNSPGDQPPQPAEYSHIYSREQINIQEWSAYGMGQSMGGRSPAVFIWSDFWWMAAQLMNADHDLLLARVILHELGHHLLMFRDWRNTGTLDRHGHVRDDVTLKRSVMKGMSLLVSRRFGREQISSAAIRAEKRFLSDLRWHPVVERTIREHYVPASRLSADDINQDP